MILPDVHYEGVVKIDKTPGVITVADSSFTADQLTAAGKGPTQALDSKQVVGNSLGPVGIYYPGAMYSDASGTKLISANTGHFGALDSLEGAMKMRSMNVFTGAGCK